MAKNIIIKPVRAKISFEEYINSGHELVEGDTIEFNEFEGTVYSISNKHKSLIAEINSTLVVIKFDNPNFYVVKECVLKSEISGIGVEQLNMFRDGKSV